MNDPDLISNKYQLKLAMDAAERLIPQIFDEYWGLTWFAKGPRRKGMPGTKVLCSGKS